MTVESENRSCPICGLEATLQQSSNKDAFTVRCRRCGQFLMAGILIRAIKTKFPDPADDELKPYLSAHTRQSSDQGTITGLDIKNWREFAKPQGVASPLSLKGKTRQSTAAQSVQLTLV